MNKSLQVNLTVDDNPLDSQDDFSISSALAQLLECESPIGCYAQLSCGRSSLGLRRISRVDPSLLGLSVRVKIGPHSSWALKSSNSYAEIQIVVVDSERIPALEKVYIEVPCAVYDILLRKDSVKQEMLDVWLHSQRGVVSTEDCIRNINGVVTLCEPVPQGRIDSSTTVVFVARKSSDVSVNENASLSDLTEFLEDSLQLCVLTGPFSAPRFRVAPLLRPPSSFTCAEMLACVSPADFSRLGFSVFSGDLVRMRTPDFDHFVSLVAGDEAQQQGLVLLSAMTIINCRIAGDTIVCFEKLQQDTHKASRVVILRVNSMITLSKVNEQALLVNIQASLQRGTIVFRTGDYFPVLLDTVAAKIMHDHPLESPTALLASPDAVAWYKVSNLEGLDGASSPHIFDPTYTTLIQALTDYSMLPSDQFPQWSRYFGNPITFNYPESDLGFNYARQLRKILNTLSLCKAHLKTSIIVTSAVRGAGKTLLVRALARELGLTLVEIDCLSLVNPSQELKTVGTLEALIDKIVLHTPSTASCFYVVLLRGIDALCPHSSENDHNSSIHQSLSLKIAATLSKYLAQYPNMCIVMTTNGLENLSLCIKQLSQFEINVNVPNEWERFKIFHHLVEECEPQDSRYALRSDVVIDEIAKQSAGLSPRDLRSIVKKAKRVCWKRLAKIASRTNTSLDDVVQIGCGSILPLTPLDFSEAINVARNQYSDSIGAPHIPSVAWDDIGGLDVAREEIFDTIDMPLRHPDLFSSGLKKRSGILFYGPPGTGKTLLAKAIATNFSLNFFSVKGPELLNMYIGESEANVRRVFERARDAKPCIIFFDELDSVAPKRGNQGDSGGVMDRIVSQLLAELDGMSGQGGDGVFVVGATNRPDLLDEALLRPGRFDKMIYLGISSTHEQQHKILQALTRNFSLHNDVDLMAVASDCPFTCTGADFYALCSDAMLNAMTRTASEVDRKVMEYNKTKNAKVSTQWWFDNVCEPADSEVLVRMQDFVKAKAELSASVSQDELRHYLRIRQTFEGERSNR